MVEDNYELCMLEIKNVSKELRGVLVSIHEYKNEILNGVPPSSLAQRHVLNEQNLRKIEGLFFIGEIKILIDKVKDLNTRYSSLSRYGKLTIENSGSISRKLEDINKKILEAKNSLDKNRNHFIEQRFGI
jgi:hypothetical protein